MTGVIQYPLVSEKAMNDMDFQNKLQFIVSIDATKDEIAAAIRDQYDVEIVKVNTQVTMRGTKKAIVTLSSDDDAQEVASRIGVF